MDNSSLPIKERMAAKAKDVLEFYHSLSRMINTSQLHKTMESIILKSDPDYVSDEDVSKALAEAEKIALDKLQNEADIREAEAIAKEAERLAAEAAEKQAELKAKRDAKIKALEAEKKRLLEEKDVINGKTPVV